MTDQPEPTQNSETSGNTTNDLRDAAREARELFEAAQAEEAARAAQSSDAETRSGEADDDVADPGTQTSMLQDPLDASEVGNTTHDLAQEAYKAMQMQQAIEQEQMQDAHQREEFHPAQTKLELSVTDMPDRLLIAVDHDLVVGRADSVTNYMPDIDLTTFGAYRLGLSRRHAIIRVEENTLIVQDLQSRNGTFVNGKAVPSGGTHPLRDGDTLRLGNLTVQLRFQRSGS